MINSAGLRHSCQSTAFMLILSVVIAADRISTKTAYRCTKIALARKGQVPDAAKSSPRVCSKASLKPAASGNAQGAERLCLAATGKH